MNEPKNKAKNKAENGKIKISTSVDNDNVTIVDKHNNVNNNKNEDKIVDNNGKNGNFSKTIKKNFVKLNVVDFKGNEFDVKIYKNSQYFTVIDMINYIVFISFF